jgi:hypothetical protein
MNKLIREPLLHFLLLGVALFALYGWLNRDGFNSRNEIVVSQGQVRNLRSQFERLWQRAPTQQELEGLINNWVREEIFYREGLAMGLDRDDPVVRRRLQQKVEFVLDSAEPAVPTTAELQRWLDEHVAEYRIEPSYSLRQVYFDPARHGEQLKAEVTGAQRALNAGKMIAGDATMLPAEVSGDAAEIARTFGSEFEKALRHLPIGSWQGPVRSGFGWHLIELTSRDEARRPRLEEVRAAVERDLLNVRAKEADSAFYGRLRANYRVRIESGDVPVAEPTG